MNITAPISSLAELKKIASLGVQEVYCGLLTSEWRKIFSFSISINRLHKPNANLQSFGELKSVIEYAHSRKIKVFLTLNEFYTQGQFASLETELLKISSMALDGLIVADTGLVHFLKQRNCRIPLHASSLAGVFNTSSAGFLKKMGAERIVFPKDLGVREIAAIVKEHNGLQFEALVMNGGCRNIDAFCSFHHGVTEFPRSFISFMLTLGRNEYKMLSSVMKLPRVFQHYILRELNRKIALRGCSLEYQPYFSLSRDECKKRQSPSYHGKLSGCIKDLFVCAGCQIMLFKQMGIASVKIVGRSLPIDKKIKDVTFIRMLISLSEQGPITPEDFKVKAKILFKKIYGYACENNCFYGKQGLSAQNL